MIAGWRFQGEQAPVNYRRTINSEQEFRSIRVMVGKHIKKNAYQLRETLNMQQCQALDNCRQRRIIEEFSVYWNNTPWSWARMPQEEAKA